MDISLTPHRYWRWLALFPAGVAAAGVFTCVLGLSLLDLTFVLNASPASEFAGGMVIVPAAAYFGWSFARLAYQVAPDHKHHAALAMSAALTVCLSVLVKAVCHRWSHHSMHAIGVELGATVAAFSAFCAAVNGNSRQSKHARRD